MGRKVRFYQPKKYERKKYAVRCLPVSIPLGGSVMLHRISIPLGLVGVPPLLVSLPLAIYRTACVTQVSQLQARLTKVSLPPNWVELRQQEMSSRLTTMTLVNFRPQTIFTTASFAVNIHEHLTWTLQCYNSPIETDQCQAITNVPQSSCTLVMWWTCSPQYKAAHCVVAILLKNSEGWWSCMTGHLKIQLARGPLHTMTCNHCPTPLYGTAAVSSCYPTVASRSAARIVPASATTSELDRRG